MIKLKAIKRLVNYWSQWGEKQEGCAHLLPEKRKGQSNVRIALALDSMCRAWLRGADRFQRVAECAFEDRFFEEDGGVAVANLADQGLWRD